MPHWLQSLILGVVQGVTEFVPVSSSGHLVLLPYLAGWENAGLAFDVALHVGTALAVLVYFRSELWGIARALLGKGRPEERALYRRLFGLLLLGSVPVAVVGLTLKPMFEDAFASPLLVSGFLLVTAGLLVVGERARGRRVERATPNTVHHEDRVRVWTGNWIGEMLPEQPAEALPAAELGADPEDPAGRDLGRIGVRHGLVVGLGQSLALFPGLSRSGTTITAGLFAGLSRPAATRFSFLLALPAMLGAAIVSLPDLRGAEALFSGPEILVGVASSFVAGYATIRWLVQLVARERLTVFVRYLIAAAAVGALGYVMTGPPSSV